LIHAVGSKEIHGDCREIQLKESQGNYTFRQTEERFADAPVYSTKLVYDSGTLFLFFNSLRGAWTVAFNASLDAQAYYTSLALVSKKWNVYSGNQWVSGGDHVETNCGDERVIQFVGELPININL
jgi:hypothetical protein